MSTAPANGVAAGLTSQDRVSLILGQLDRLPTLPVVASRLLAITTSDESSARDVVEVIESDASLTAAVLRLIKQADRGVPGEGMSVAKAVTLLGFSAVRNTVLSLQLYGVFPVTDQGDPDGRRQSLWLHSLAVACMSEAIASRVSRDDQAGHAFVCGLLHDIGKIALDACLPKSYARAVQRAQQQRTCICDIERELLGLDHTTAGRRLVERWGLPTVVAESVWLHHQPPTALPPSLAHPDMVRIVHLANKLVQQQGLGCSGYLETADVDGLASSIGLTTDVVDELATSLPQRVSQLAESLGLKEYGDQSKLCESLERANRELGRINAKLSLRNQELETQSACFDAMARFGGLQSAHQTVAMVCAAAADAVAGMLGADEAVGFSAHATGRCIDIGQAVRSKQELDTSIVDPGERDGTHPSSLLPGGVALGRLVEAGESGAKLWHQSGATPTSAQLALLPIESTNGRVAGVLVPVSREVFGRFQSAGASCAVLADAIGKALASARDRSARDRLNEELVAVSRRLSNAQKEVVRSRSLAMIAQMAAGAAHELNNPLAVISGRAQLLQRDCTDPDQTRALDAITEHAHRASRIVAELIQFAKPDAPKPVEANLSNLIESWCQHWRTHFSLSDDQLTCAIADTSATVFADVDQLREAVDAVMTNAIEAVQPTTARLQVNSPSSAADETVRLVVVDNGGGMAPSVLEHAVDPFFSHRPAGRGRGLGLSRATRLVEIGGGRLWLDSTKDIGTTVTIELPARRPADTD